MPVTLTGTLMRRFRFLAVFALFSLLLGACDSTTPQEFLERARVSFDRGDYQTSIIELKNALQQQPDLGAARTLLGLAQVELGEYAGALRELERAQDLGESGDVLTFALLSAKNRTGRYQEVIGELAEVQQLSSQLTATQALEKAVSLAPDAAAFRNQLALSLVSSGEIERAKGTLTSAIEVDGDQIQSEYLLAMLRIRDRDFPAALEAIDALIEKSPDNPIGFNLKGNVLLAQGDWPNATAAFTRALQLDLGYFPAAVSLARLDLHNGDAAAARTRYENVLAADSANTDARLALVDLLIEQGAGREAETLLEETIAGEPDAIAPRIRLVRLLMTQDRHIEALRKIRPALELAGQSQLAELELLAAQLDLHNGNVASARTRAETIQRLLAKREQPAAVLTTLGTLQARTGQLAPARDNFEQALMAEPDSFQANPENASVRYHLGRAHLAIGDRKAAAAALRQALELGNFPERDSALTTLADISDV